jgi:hypothetical protein
MSTRIFRTSGGIDVTRFHGGVDRGPCLQLTGPFLCRCDGTLKDVERRRSVGEAQTGEAQYVQLTAFDVRELLSVFTQFLKSIDP